MRRWSRPALASLALALWLPAAVASAEERIGIATGEHEGYARIAFAFAKSMAFEAKLDGRTLRVHFAAPLSGDLAQIPRRLAGYVDAAAMDGAADIVLTLHRDLGLKSFTTDDKKVVIDLLDRPGEAAASGAAKPAPAEPPPAQPFAAKTADLKPAEGKPGEGGSAAGAAGLVPVTVADEGSERRIVFAWPRRTEYSYGSAKGEWHLRFKNADPIDVERLTSDAADLTPKVERPEKDVAVALHLPAGAKLAVKREGDSVVAVVSGLNATPKPNAAPEAKADATKAEAAKVEPTKAVPAKPEPAKPQDAAAGKDEAPAGAALPLR